ncbi:MULTISPECIES: 50S ribosomal protein L25/general stress protein Ctc [Ferrimonas]|uniref:50S ribosomal protein L25/general stress protein Ctc n=1 Tax=Ferrimonas TaxID=44011 RepID=UPI00041A372F|nr:MULTISPECIES: 50S ribosomal protein L25/general stress protein Ctc [Ferrimonas]USD38255.1 50S ribosomal protein L25/general stress protein Ctc [Ferrimonas sp. SCSIO 43195]
MSELTLDAQLRAHHGTGASRRLRHQGEVPGIVYGGKEENVSITLPHNQLMKAQEQESFYSQVINLKLDGKSVPVIVKALQRHPYKPKVMHIDLMRINRNEPITAMVPIHFINEEIAAGVKAGGSVSHHLTELELRSLPADLPEYIEIDTQHLGTGDTLHLSDITLPAGVESVTLAKGEDHNVSVVTIQPPRGGEEDSDEQGESQEDSE